MLTKHHTIRLTCAHGQHEMLADELRSFGHEPTRIDRSGVECHGDLTLIMKLNLESRIAMRVLVLMRTFDCTHIDSLYSHIHNMNWEELIDVDGHLTVTSTVRTKSVDNTMYPNLKVKDAIVDRIREKCGRRPNSGAKPLGVVVHLHWNQDQAMLWLDSSGDKLADRGYRKMPHQAPLRETLAATILRRASYDGSAPLVIPMCGSGTLAIEGALMALGRPPGLLRRNFSFMHWKQFDESHFAEVRRSVSPRRSRHHRAAKPTIIATDNNAAAVDATRRNAETAGVGHLLETAVCDFAETPMPHDTGHIILHPEYGHRLGSTDELQSEYKRMGDFFKQKCAG